MKVISWRRDLLYMR